MKRLLSLSIFPLIGVALIALAWLWSSRDIRLRLFGVGTDGRIVGMALQRTSGVDILTGIDTLLMITLADGRHFKARYENYSLQLAGFSEHGTSPVAQGDLEMKELMEAVVRGSAEDIRWTLLRESRKVDDSARVVRIEKTETVHAALGMNFFPAFTMASDELALHHHKNGASAMGTIVVRTIFDYSDSARVARNKGESMVSYEYLRDGRPVQPARRDFYLRAEPYETQFLPIFQFVADGDSMARLSHIGRHGGPTLALQLFGACRVYFDPANPMEAILMADPGPVGGKPLAWFSEYCEGLFGQWGSTALIALAGLLFISTGLVLISLALLPSSNLMLSVQNKS